LSYEYHRIYSIFIIFSIQFRSTNSIRIVHCASLMVIIFFSRVSRLPLDCVGYQSSKAKWSIFSLLFLCFCVLRNFLLYPPAPAALVNCALTPITHNLRCWIELIFLLFKSSLLCSYQNICGYICPPTLFFLLLYMI